MLEYKALALRPARPGRQRRAEHPCRRAGGRHQRGRRRCLRRHGKTGRGTPDARASETGTPTREGRNPRPLGRGRSSTVPGLDQPAAVLEHREPGPAVLGGQLEPGRARRRGGQVAAGSDSGQGPAQPVTRRGGSPRTASRAGAAETAQRPLTVTARPASSVTSASRAEGKTRLGAVPLTRPGQGGPPGRRGSVFSPNGMGVAWSCTFLPPPTTGRSTASCPSMACTRIAARATRSLTSVSPTGELLPGGPDDLVRQQPQRDDAARGRGLVGRRGQAGCRRAASGPVRLSRPRTAARGAGTPPAAPARPPRWRLTCTRTQVSPRAARPSCSRPASALAANTTGSARGSGGSNSWATDRSGDGGRAASGRESRPRASRCAPSPASPNRLATSRTGSAAKSPSVRRPSRFSSATRSWAARSWPARTLTGWAARNLAVPPGGTFWPSRAARSAANSPSATPALLSLAEVGQRGGDPGGQRRLAAEVAGRTAGAERAHPRLHHLHVRAEPGHRGDHPFVPVRRLGVRAGAQVRTVQVRAGHDHDPRRRRVRGGPAGAHPLTTRSGVRRRVLEDIEREVCGIGHGDAAVLAGQPEPARPRHGRLPAAVRHHLRAAGPQPPVPVAEPGPPLAGDAQPQLRPGPVPGHEQHAAPAPQRRLETLPDLRRRPRGRAQQDELAAVEQRRHHLRPGRAGLGDQQGPSGVQAEGRGRQHPGLGYPRDPAPRPVRRRGGRQRQAEQAELRHGHHRPAREPAPRQQLAQRGQHRQRPGREPRPWDRGAGSRE